MMDGYYGTEERVSQESRTLENQDALVDFLERNWRDLLEELGEDWDIFVNGFQEATEPLRIERSPESWNQTVSRLDELLERTQFGHSLFEKLRSLIAMARIPSGQQILVDSEHLSGLGNRLPKVADDDTGTETKKKKKKKKVPDGADPSNDD